MQKLTEQHKAKISMAMKGRKLSEEHKTKLRVAMKGINTWARLSSRNPTTGGKFVAHSGYLTEILKGA